MNKTRQQQAGKQTNNQLRIIAGEWRGRKLTFPSSEGLRPTPDRVRETVFNWLAPSLPGANCLDLFAGSGALGLEALSRGAAHVDLVDNSSEVIQQLRQNLQLLKAQHGHVWMDNANNWLQTTAQHDIPGTPNSYDIIFLDPPFRKGLADDCINAIDQFGWLAKQSWVYLEMATDEPLPGLPGHWKLHRERTAGQVCYRLFSIG